VDPQEEVRVLRRIGQPGLGVGPAHVLVHRADSRGGLIRRRDVAVCDGEHVSARRGQTAERVALPVAVLGDTGHRQRMQGLDHKRAHSGEREAAVAMHAPDDAAGAEEPCVGGLGRD